MFLPFIPLTISRAYEIGTFFAATETSNNEDYGTPCAFSWTRDRVWWVFIVLIGLDRTFKLDGKTMWPGEV